MNRFTLSLACLLVTAPPLAAQDLPPGVTSARMLAGWTQADGSRMAAIEVNLQPGWKTYWRNPGDSGLPPTFDWTGSQNMGEVTFHWPAPEAIRSGDSLAMGYHDRLVLPFTVTPKEAGKPIDLVTVMDFGLCEKVCVPAHVSMRADAPADAPVPEIVEALESVPRPADHDLTCQMQDIADGVRVSVTLPPQKIELAALELADDPDVWVSGTDMTNDADGVAVAADFVPPSGKPFPLDTTKLRVTVIGPEGAVEMQGCTPKG